MALKKKKTYLDLKEEDFAWLRCLINYQGSSSTNAILLHTSKSCR